MDKYKEYSILRKKLQESGDVPEFISTAGFQLLKDKKYIEGDETIKDRFTTIANTLALHLPEKHQDYYRSRFFQMMWAGILGPSTPVYSNTGRPSKGLPISCSGSYVPDEVSGFYEVAHEIAMLSKNGFGTSVYLGDIRPRGSKIANGTIADGVVPVMKLIYNTANHISQGSTRRGSVACYLPISHPDFHEVCHWLENNTDGSNFGWSWTHADIQALDDGDPDMTERYQTTMYLRMLGIGYYINIDNINELNPKVYKDNDIKVLASNLCSEISLASSRSHTFTCCLSSLNLSKWDAIKEDPQTIFDSIVFLDCVNSEFIKQSEGLVGLQKARDFAAWSRPVGLGVMGLSTYMQSKSIVFDSFEGHLLNTSIFKTIREYADKANEWLGKELGEPELMKGTGLRCSHLIAVAPTLCVTSDTKIILSDDSTVDFETLIRDGGIEYDDLTSVVVELDNGEVRKFRYDEIVQVNRSGNIILIPVSELLDTDDFII